MTSTSGNPDLSTVTPIAEGTGLSKQVALSRCLNEAREYLLFYNWCESIEEEYVGAYVDGVIGIFLFRFTPKLVSIDEWVWVVVGDLPPAYLTCESCPNPAEALEGYLGEMMEWVEAAENGDSVAKLIPVNVPASQENAARLRTRLRFLQQRILPGLRNLP